MSSGFCWKTFLQCSEPVTFRWWDGPIKHCATWTAAACFRCCAVWKETRLLRKVLSGDQIRIFYVQIFCSLRKCLYCYVLCKTQQLTRKRATGIQLACLEITHCVPEKGIVPGLFLFFLKLSSKEKLWNPPSRTISCSLVAHFISIITSHIAFKGVFRGVFFFLLKTTKMNQNSDLCCVS